MSYEAIIARINTREFPNADRLLLGTCLGNQVVVGKDTQDGEIGAFFPADGQLSETFCKEHDLIGYTDPATGEKRGGFFARNRRVRAQRFRGEKSDGFWVPLSYFDYTGIKRETLVEGYMFTELCGHPICNKFETQATKAAKGQQAKAKKKNVMFAEHVETEQLTYFADQIPAGSLITITRKLHGTSHRAGNVLDDLPLPVWKHYLNRILHRDVFAAKSIWREIHGTRRVVLGETLVDSYYNEAFRGKATAKLQGQLRKGEVVYLEIVGWVNESTPIMATQDVTKLKDKAVEKQYGKTMTYKYGCQPGEQAIYVYRITQVNEDGKAIELSWNQVVARCKELGVNTVPFITQFIYAEPDAEGLLSMAEAYATGPAALDPSHIEEGVVLRVDQPDGQTNWYKYKSFLFKVLEGIVKDDETVIDIEEAS
ncbi:hypothetical protein ANRL4_03094 [Anaerolineae bacterium]|nr:hypothetical protein ANRL4_03094 [Anaerolineae bacterium]